MSRSVSAGRQRHRHDRGRIVVEACGRTPSWDVIARPIDPRPQHRIRTWSRTTTFRTRRRSAQRSDRLLSRRSLALQATGAASSVGSSSGPDDGSAETRDERYRQRFYSGGEPRIEPCPAICLRRLAAVDDPPESRSAGCSTKAMTREAMKRAVRTVAPPRVTSATSMIVRPVVTSTRRPARVAASSNVCTPVPTSTVTSTRSPRTRPS